MKTHQVIGRRIVAVNQSRVKTWGGIHMTVNSLTLDNGVSLLTTAYLTDDAPVGDLLLHAPVRVARSKRPNP